MIENDAAILLPTTVAVLVPTSASIFGPMSVATFAPMNLPAMTLTPVTPVSSSNAKPSDPLTLMYLPQGTLAGSTLMSE